MASWKNEVSILIGFSLLVMNSSVKSQNEDIKPVIKCTSITERSYKCEWNILLGVNYTYETRAKGTDQWSLLQMPQNHNGIASTRVIKVNLGNENMQEIRVNVMKDNSSASKITTHDIKTALKPNITYKKLIMTATSATLTWSTENIERTYWSFLSQLQYGECDDETTYETCEMVKLFNINHETTSVTKEINDLKPGRFYKFGVRSKYTRPGNGYSSWKYVVNETEESRPSEEVQFEIQEDDTLLKWKAVPKASQNGKILGYKIYVNGGYVDKVSITQWSLKGIDGGIYNICITAYNDAGESPVNCTQVELNSTNPTQLNPTEPTDLISGKSSKDMSIVLVISVIVGLTVA